jgi:integrase
MNDQTDDRPFLSSYKDRHGKTRWRFRRGKIDRSLPGQPGDQRFEEAYQAAIDGRPPIAQIVHHPNHALPRTLKAAWRLATASNNMDWQKLGQTSKDAYIDRAERLLAMECRPGHTYADCPVVDLKRRHVKALIGSMSEAPHAAYDALVVLRKMIMVALDEEWIEVDPTHRIKYRPQIDGHRAWTDDERAKFEAYWPLGTIARTAYACAFYLGTRRGNNVDLKWTDFDGDTLPHTQPKTGKRLVLPVLPGLRQALDAAPRNGPYVLGTIHGGRRKDHTLTTDFYNWTHEAGLGDGCTGHGLRKTLGKILAEEGATTKELMATLGHESIAHAQLYSDEADQERLAQSAMDKIRDRVRPRLRVVGGEPIGEPSENPKSKA